MARVLIIDDNEDLLGMLEEVLQAAGHTVAIATDGLKAAGLFRVQPFEVIVTDLVMPNCEGVETIITLRREFSQVRVIAMTAGNHSRTYLELASRLGAHHTLAKPFAFEELIQVIASLVKQPPIAPTGQK